MPIVTRTIHRKLITRLALGWLLLSILMGAVVYYVETSKVDEFVVNLAIKESGSFLQDNVDYLNSPDPAHHALLLERSEEHIRKGHFIALALYTRDRKKILAVVRTGLDAIVMEPHGEVLRKTDRVEYRTLYIDRQIAVHVFVPLKDRTGGITGYFEGIYQVDRKTMSDIQGRIASSLFLVVIVVLVTTVILYPVIISLNKDLMRLSVDLSHANLGMLKVLGSAVAKRDSDTNIHNYRVALYAVRLAEAVGLKETEIKSLIKGAFLHDVGKIGISDTILLKPGKLSADEFTVMKTHPRHGADIIGKYAWLGDALDVVKYHQEKYDGTGYGEGLKGEYIPLSARIFAVVDVFDALTSRRPYKDAMTFDSAMAVMEKDRETHFDPKLFDAFSRIARKHHEEIGQYDDAKIEKMLDDILRKYFDYS
jgi:HD-GYP domain-containing protein (c-di-GMP phosphodiesterase class II)